MDVLSPFLHVLLRSIVVLFPMTVGLLAFRRLALSRSANAWIYAVMCLFAAVTTAGVLPWTLGLTSLSWPLIFMALTCPMMWVAVIMLCDISRTHRYGPDPMLKIFSLLPLQNDEKDRYSSLSDEAKRKIEPQSPVFKHRDVCRSQITTPSQRSKTTNTLLSLARDIRGNSNSDRRRPKLLPPPETKDLPFLSRSNSA